MSTEQTGESTAGGETQRAVPTPFLTKTYQLVDDPAVDDLISWNDDGSGFIIWRPAEFARDLLPKYFKHNNLSSFVRQLNTYGFRKVVPDRWEFANDCFKKGEKGLLRDILRRKMVQSLTTSSAAAAIAPSAVQLMQVSPSNSGDDQVFSSTSSPGGKQATNCTTPELVDENERLKKENQQMMHELSHLRGLCNNIFMMMSNYGPSGQQDPGNPSMESKQLDLFQSERYSEEQGGSSGGNAGTMDEKECEDRTKSPKLFGVSIGSKRVKRCVDSESSQKPDEPQAENNSKSSKKERFEMKLELSQSGPSHSR